MAAEQGVDVDRDGFAALMRGQRERARADARERKAGGSAASALRPVLDAHGPTEWLAWKALTSESRVLALLGASGPVAAAGEGDIVTAVLDRTPFYAESGGQDSDAGGLSGTSSEAEVMDVQRPLPGLVVHQIRITAGELAVGDPVLASVDPQWRRGARQAHSGTHVLHAALRQVLGPTASTLLTRLKAADQENRRIRKERLLARAAELPAAASVTADGTRVVTATVEDAAQARPLALADRGRLPDSLPAVVAVGAATNRRASVVVVVNAAGRGTGLSATSLVKAALGGRGGGFDEIAQGGPTPRRCPPSSAVCASTSVVAPHGRNHLGGRGVVNAPGRPLVSQPAPQPAVAALAAVNRAETSVQLTRSQSLVT